MIAGIFHKGSGLGNQLFRYVFVRCLAMDLGYDFGMQNHENFKGASFLNINMGSTLKKLKYSYNEPRINLNNSMIDIRTYDFVGIAKIKDGTLIDGEFQGEKYFMHRKNEIREWLKIKDVELRENLCIINFRGGEYIHGPELFLAPTYWENAINNMRKIRVDMKFKVVTDDIKTAKKFFPTFEISHDLENDYTSIQNAYYLILSNSSFALMPAWLNQKVKFVIAPKYWGRHNISDGYWSCEYNMVNGWMYQDRNGNLSNYESCIKDLKEFKENNTRDNSPIYLPPLTFRKKIKNMVMILNYHSLKNIMVYVLRSLKKFFRYYLNDLRNLKDFLFSPFDIIKNRVTKKSWLSKEGIKNYRKKIKIYDIFIFFNELELLEIRLNILDKYVDYFVIIEATETFTGIPKKLYFQENKQLFLKWQHKIIHYIVTDTPKNIQELEQRLLKQNLPELDKIIIQTTITTKNIPDKSESQWVREFYQKEMARKILVNLSDDDFCYISDLDEVWNPEILIDYSREDVFKFKQDPYVYYLNNRSNENWVGWVGTTATKYKNIKNIGINHIRTYDRKKLTIIRNGGWHFTFQGGAQMIRQKLESYSHQEINTEGIKHNMENIISLDKDIRGRHIKFWKDETRLPQYILRNKEKYINFFRQ